MDDNNRHNVRKANRLIVHSAFTNKRREMSSSQSKHRMSMGSIPIPASNGHSKKPSLDGVYSSFQKLFQQKQSVSSFRSKSRAFGFTLPDASIQALLREGKTRPNFDFPRSRSRVSFEGGVSGMLGVSAGPPAHYIRAKSSRPKLDAILSDKSRSPEVSRQIPTCKVQRRIHLRQRQPSPFQEHNSTIKAPAASEPLCSTSKKPSKSSAKKSKVRSAESVKPSKPLRNSSPESRKLPAETSHLRGKILRLRGENLNLKGQLADFAAQIDELRRDTKDFLLLQYFGDLSERPSVINRINELVKERYKELYKGDKGKPAPLSDQRIEQILDLLASEQPQFSPGKK